MALSRRPCVARARDEGRGVDRHLGRELPDDDVGLDGGDVEHDAGRARQRLGEAARVGVILGEPRDVVLERVQAGGGEDAGLAHAAAEHLAPAVRRDG